MVKNVPAMRNTWVGSLDWKKTSGEGNGDSLQYFCLENSMNRGAWWAMVIAKSQTQLRDFHFTLLKYYSSYSI